MVTYEYILEDSWLHMNTVILWLHMNTVILWLHMNTVILWLHMNTVILWLHMNTVILNEYFLASHFVTIHCMTESTIFMDVFHEKVTSSSPIEY